MLVARSEQSGRAFFCPHYFVRETRDEHFVNWKQLFGEYAIELTLLSLVLKIGPIRHVGYLKFREAFALTFFCLARCRQEKHRNDTI